MRRLLVPALGVFLLSAQTPATGPQVTTFLSAVDSTEQPYALYIPKNFDASRQYPLVISLHGAYSNHRLNLRRVFGKGNRPGETDAEASRFFPPLKDVDFIVASPFARGTMGYSGIAEKDVYDVLADVRKRFPIDQDRIYLTGLSMGGGGALRLAMTRPDIWAAVAAVCPTPLPDLEALAGNLINIPVKIFQGALDPLVRAEDTRAWHKRLLAAGVQAEYVEYPGVRHNAWDTAYRDAAVFDWFAKHRRLQSPPRVRFATGQYRYASAHWLTIDALAPGTMGVVDATLKSPRTIAVEANEIEGFTLGPIPFTARTIEVQLNGKPLQVRNSASLSFTKTGSGWVSKRYQTAAGEKRAGAEGPITDAVAGRHIYVYGTGGAADTEELTRRRQSATLASNWRSPRTPVTLTFDVTADDELPADDDPATLILFGTKETNSRIRRYATQLPMELNAGAADYGLVYVTHIHGRYVVVNSGLPWWTRSELLRAPELDYTAGRFRLLEGYGDYVLFRGGMDNVVTSGRFDRNWRLHAAAAAQLTATGVVTVNAPPAAPAPARPARRRAR